jgi:naphthalene 1,2-dioxygenase ferredoxin component
MSVAPDLVWVKALPVSALSEYGVAGCEVGGQRMALYAVDDQYFATSDICTHGAARLSDGYLDGDLIECPLHQGLFNVRTGAAAGAPCSVAVASFPVKQIDGDLYVGFAESQT